MCLNFFWNSSLKSILDCALIGAMNTLFSIFEHSIKIFVGVLWDWKNLQDSSLEPLNLLNFSFNEVDLSGLTWRPYGVYFYPECTPTQFAVYFMQFEALRLRADWIVSCVI